MMIPKKHQYYLRDGHYELFHELYTELVLKGAKDPAYIYALESISMTNKMNLLLLAIKELMKKENRLK